MADLVGEHQCGGDFFHETFDLAGSGIAVSATGGDLGEFGLGVGGGYFVD